MQEDFGLRLIKAREYAGLTQEKAAELLGISVRTLAHYESNQSKPKMERMNTIVELYQDEQLGYQYILTFDLGKRLFGGIKEKSFAESVLSFAVNIKQSGTHVDDLMTIGADGKVDEQEKPKYKQILNVFRLMAKDVLMLRFYKNKKAEPRSKRFS